MARVFIATVCKSNLTFTWLWTVFCHSLWSRRWSWW